MNTSKFKNIEPILKITKNVIKKSDNFNDYYLHKNNSLYHNQLPLLKVGSRIKEIMALKKLKNKNSFSFGEKFIDNNTNQEKINNSYISYANIRKPNIRSQKIPSLCPFYSKRGELLPQVVATSKISMNTFITESNNDLNFFGSSFYEKNTSRRPFFSLTPLNYKKNNYNEYYKKFEINFDEFEKEILYDSEYRDLKFENSKIFGHKELYIDYIKELVEEILVSTNDEDKSRIYEDSEIKKEKNFFWGKNKLNIYLTLNSINVKIKEITNKDTINNTNENTNNMNNNDLKDIFEYNLPINLLPLFYYKGFEKFKLFLLSFISFDEQAQKFEVNKNIPKIINLLLSNCKDIEIRKNMDEKIKIDTLNIVKPLMKKSTKEYKLSQNKFEKKQSKNYSTLKIGKSMNYDQSLPKNQIFANTNVNILPKKNYKKLKFDLYPKEKKKFDFLNYSIFNFFWTISDKTYLVTVEMPLIIFEIPDYKIMVKQYINFELLFYLFQLKFKVWDFYVVKYLSSFKMFRILLTQLLSIKSKKNACFYLEKYRIKNFESTDCKIINILTSKFLFEENNKDKKDDNDLEAFYLKQIEELNEEKNVSKKPDIKEEKKDEENKEKKNGKELNKDNNMKKEETKKEEKNKEKESPISNNININESLPNDKNIDKVSDNKLNNLILEQKNFMAIVTFNDIEKSLINQYKIHFNYSQFTKFKTMETYMKKIYFLLKFISIDYNQNTISFDYNALNAFEEKNWMKEVEKYSFNYIPKIQNENNNINKDEEKNEILINNNKIEFTGVKKGQSIVIEIRQPILLLRSIDKNGKIYTKVVEILDDKEKMVSLNDGDNVLNLIKNIYDIGMYYKQKEIGDKNNKELADNILRFAFKKNLVNKQ